MDRLWLCQFVDEGFGFDGASGTTCSMNIVVAYLDLVDLIVQKKIVPFLSLQWIIPSFL